MPVTPKGIVSPNAPDNYDLVVDLAAMASSIDTAIGASSNAFKGTAAQRAAFLSTAAVGQLWQDTDGIGMIWKKVGAAWVPAVWRWAGTNAQMTAFTQAPVGFEWFNTTDNATYTRLSSTWVGVATTMLLTSNISLAAATHTILTSATPWTVSGGKLTTTHWNNGIVAPVAGTYKITASLNAAAGINLLVAAKKNDTSASITGAVSLGMSTGAFSYTTATLNESVQLAANDVITLDVLSNVATTLRAGFGSFSLERVG